VSVFGERVSGGSETGESKLERIFRDFFVRCGFPVALSKCALIGASHLVSVDLIRYCCFVFDRFSFFFVIFVVLVYDGRFFCYR
jgi:hypothetical protein